MSNVRREFEKKGVSAAKSLYGTSPLGPRLIAFGDARAIPLRSSSVDCIVTSPPYANAIDYMRAHKFSLVWLGASIEQLGHVRTNYIGYEGTKPKGDMGSFPQGVRKQIWQVEDVDRPKSTVLANYFLDMSSCIREMLRVLRPQGAVVIIVGPSLMRDVTVSTQDCIAELLAETGFDVVGVSERSLDRDRRLMPVSGGAPTLAGIERRMHREYVIGAIKP